VRSYDAVSRQPMAATIDVGIKKPSISSILTPLWWGDDAGRGRTGTRAPGPRACLCRTVATEELAEMLAAQYLCHAIAEPQAILRTQSSSRQFPALAVAKSYK
jgi:hypothetical protein